MGECMMQKIGGGGTKLERCILASNASWYNGEFSATFDISGMDLSKRIPMNVTAIVAGKGSTFSPITGDTFYKNYSCVSTMAICWNGSNMSDRSRPFIASVMDTSTIETHGGDTQSFQETVSISDDKKTLAISFPAYLPAATPEAVDFTVLGVLSYCDSD